MAFAKLPLNTFILCFKYPDQPPQTPPLYELVPFLYDFHQLHEKSTYLYSEQI